MIHVRHATGADATWLLEQLREFSAFFGTKKPLFPSDPAVAASLVYAFIAGMVFFVAEDYATMRPVGFIAGTLSPHPMNPEIRVLAETFWWVSSDRRGSSAGARLLERFIAFGRANAEWVVMTLEAKSPVAPASLERRGFLLHERSYLLEV